MRRESSEIREPTFLILTALAAGTLHGYAIIQHVDTLSGGRVTLRPGTLYGALDRLAESGLVVAGWAGDPRSASGLFLATIGRGLFRFVPGG